MRRSGTNTRAESDCRLQKSEKITASLTHRPMKSVINTLIEIPTGGCTMSKLSNALTEAALAIISPLVSGVANGYYDIRTGFRYHDIPVI